MLTLMSGRMAVWFGTRVLMFAVGGGGGGGGGAGVFAFASGSCSIHRSWGHLELLPPDSDSGSERPRFVWWVVVVGGGGGGGW